MRRPVALALATSVAVTLLGPSGPAQADLGAGPACGDTVTGSVVLTADLVCATGPGLVLTTGSTLDLGGHTLRGPGAGSGAVGVVLRGEPSTATAVLAGTIEGWEAGVAADPTESLQAAAVIEDVTVRDTTAGLRSDLGGSDYRVARSHFVANRHGISGAWLSLTTVTDSTFTGNHVGIHSFGGGRTDVDRSRFAGNGTGVSCSEQALRVAGSTFVDNDVAARGWWCKTTDISASTFRRNGTGWASEGDLMVENSPPDVLRDNRFTGNGTAVHAQESTHLVANTFTRNDTAFHGEANAPDDMFPERFVLEENTFRRNRDAVVIPVAAAELRGNHAVRNTRHGIWASPSTTDLGGNVARRNGAEPQCTGVACARR